MSRLPAITHDDPEDSLDPGPDLAHDVERRLDKAFRKAELLAKERDGLSLSSLGYHTQVDYERRALQVYAPLLPRMEIVADKGERECAVEFLVALKRLCEDAIAEVLK